MPLWRLSHVQSGRTNTDLMVGAIRSPKVILLAKSQMDTIHIRQVLGNPIC
jgi:hypothetical protein